jgi:molybdopterin-guanine dinucleotide biosynthesis protein A
MGGIDKGLVDLAGAPMVAHVVRRLRPQVKRIIISANRNQSEYLKWTEQVVADAVGEFDGPLAGVASALELVNTEYAATAPCDSPLLAEDMVSRMYHACVTERADIAVASDGSRLQPVFSLLRASLGPSIADFLDSGERKIDKWYQRHAVVTVDFSDVPESFMNINTDEDKAMLLAQGGLHD